MTTPTIITRAGKGAALSYDELDANFTNLRDAIGSGSGFTSNTSVVTASSATTYNLSVTNQIIFVNVTATSGTVTLKLNGIENKPLIPYILVVKKDSLGAQVNIVLDSVVSGGLSYSNAVYANEIGTVVFDVLFDTLFSTGGLSSLFVKRRYTTDNYPAAQGPTVIGQLTSSQMSGLSGELGQMVISVNGSTGTLQYWNGTAWASASGYSLPTASTTTLGGVKVDGSTITISGGVITANYTNYSLPQATTSTLGGVKVDGTTITATSGVISAATPTIDAGNLSGTTLKSTVVNSSLTSVGTLSGLSTIGAVTITYLPGSTTGQALSITAKNTLGGSGYADVLKFTNSATGATNTNKTLRLNSTGALELINSAYTGTIFSITDAGIVNLGTASVTSSLPTTNAINLNNNGYLFNDGNLHIHSSSGAIWINPLDSTNVQIGTQSTTGTGAGIVVQGNITSNTTGSGHSFFPKVQTGFNINEPSLAMDNLNVRLRNTSGSNLLIEASAVSGSFSAYTTLTENISGQALRGSTNSGGITFSAGSWTSVNATYTLSSGGDTTVFQVVDTSNSRIYRVTAIHCNGTKGGYISIERMV